jgi:hypothetical protein
MLTKLHRPSPALVVASLALFVSLAGTAVSAGVVPLAKRALVADNAKKLGGKTRAQVAATPGPATTLGGKTADEIAAMPGPADTLNGKTADEIAATPGPASTAAGVVTERVTNYTLAPAGEQDFASGCAAGEKVVGGGFNNDHLGGAPALTLADRPSPDATVWRVFLVNLSDSSTASGQIFALCVK